MKPNFTKGGGLLPVVVQEAQSGVVLMLAYMNETAWESTIKTGLATYWSRSRGKLWVKGESSGNVQKVKEIMLDCDEDTILLKVEQIGGAACHTGYASCFYRRLNGEAVEIVAERIFNPEEVYK
ncbi:MAG: phosphoribosyl-AMP cyclohydrolase [Deltaproteobacteria bacterium]|nr:phosphoribosyl-AMP cyclohydrolase [Deltaproteobacteria bacterium]